MSGQLDLQSTSEGRPGATRRTLTIVVVTGLLGVLAPSLASASTPGHAVISKAKHCRKGSHHVVKGRGAHRHLVCVKNRRHTKPRKGPKQPTTMQPPRVLPQPGTTPPLPPPPPVIMPPFAKASGRATAKAASVSVQWEPSQCDNYSIWRLMPVLLSAPQDGGYTWTISQLWGRPTNQPNAWASYNLGSYFYQGASDLNWTNASTGVEANLFTTAGNWTINSGWTAAIVQWVYADGQWSSNYDAYCSF